MTSLFNPERDPFFYAWESVPPHRRIAKGDSTPKPFSTEYDKKARHNSDPSTVLRKEGISMTSQVG
jgi:hypothetical protein